MLLFAAALGQIAKWENALTLGDALVAAGTLALALATVWLVLQTKREVKFSASSIDLARQGIEAQDMPFVVAVPDPEQVRQLEATRDPANMWWGLDEAGEYTIRIRFWNIGRGPAIARDVRLDLGDGEILPYTPGEQIIHAGGAADYVLGISGDPPDGEAAGTLRVYYAHTDGTEYMTKSDVGAFAGGVRCVDFKRVKSDGEGRSVADLTGAADDA